jgi:cytochrome P450
MRQMIADLRRGGPLGMLDAVGARAGDGAMTRLNLGPFKPYLVWHPADLQRILRDNADNYGRGMAMWSVLERLAGNGIGGEGPRWEISRAVLEPLFRGSHLNRTTDQMISTIHAAVDRMGRRAEAGEPIIASVEMTRIVQRVINPTFFAGAVPEEDGDRLGAAVASAMRSLLWRMALPFVPAAVPLPGDRTYRRSTAIVHEILRPVVETARSQDRQGDDVVSRLLHTTGPDGEPLTDEQITHDVVALFVAGSESSAIGLTWAWVALAQHPEVAARVVAEVDEVLGDAVPSREHIRKLDYTRRFLDEVLRLYSVGWAVPRVAREDDVISGVPIKRGSTLVINPYLTHRLPEVWERPLEFDPDRHTSEQVRARHRLAYLPFGHGAHVCLGQALFAREAVMILAMLLRRFRVEVDGPVQPQLSLTLQPRDPVRLRLTRR